jgi:hypothetical protein
MFPPLFTSNECLNSSGYEKESKREKERERVKKKEFFVLWKKSESVDVEI